MGFPYMYLQCIRESKRNFKSIDVRELTNQRDATHFENERVCKGFMLCKRDSVYYDDKKFV